MRKVISNLLVLALIAGICNAQAPARPNGGPPARPQAPGATTARPGRPNVVPNAPTRQQAPITRQPNAPTRATSAPSRPGQPGRPPAGPQAPQQPQQGPVQRPPTSPTRPNATPPAANVPRPGQPQAPQPQPPASNVPRPGQPQPPATDAPAANIPRPGQPGNPPQPQQPVVPPVVRPPTNDGDVDIDDHAFPTAPTIAPTPDVVFVTTPRQGPNAPIHPNIPITPWNPRLNEGRPDNRCPLNQDSRNPTHLAHESDCSRFLKCDHGIAFEYRCPEGQHWNARRNYCDFPANANCRVGNQHTVPAPLPPRMPEWDSNWGNSNNNIVPWTNPPFNPNPGFENPIIIPMAPRS